MINNNVNINNDVNCLACLAVPPKMCHVATVVDGVTHYVRLATSINRLFVACSFRVSYLALRPGEKSISPEKCVARDEHGRKILDDAT